MPLKLLTVSMLSSTGRRLLATIDASVQSKTVSPAPPPTSAMQSVNMIEGFIMGHLRECRQLAIEFNLVAWWSHLDWHLWQWGDWQSLHQSLSLLRERERNPGENGPDSIMYKELALFLLCLLCIQDDEQSARLIRNSVEPLLHPRRLILILIFFLLFLQRCLLPLLRLPLMPQLH
jgi:hypothetical protein